jgi:hypothetical protein
MHTEEAYRLRKHVVWGLLLIVVGSVVLLDRLYYIDSGPLWHYWPLLLVVVGINQTIGYPNAREFGNGLWIVFIGLWLFACFEHVYGLTFGNSWPLFILAAGVKMVARPLIERRFSQTHALNNLENRNEK